MPTLRALLDSPDQSVRLKAALAAGTYPEDEFIEILISQCAIEPDFFVRDTLSWALMRNDVSKVVKYLVTEFEEKGLLNVFKYVYRNAPFPNMGYDVQKAEGKELYRVTVSLGDIETQGGLPPTPAQPSEGPL